MPPPLTLSPTELIFGKDKDNINKELPVDIIRKFKLHLFIREILSIQSEIN